MGKETAEKYVGFGQYEKVPAALCDGAKGLWSGKSYLITRRWAAVTCKKCLKLKPNNIMVKDDTTN